jgi:hypothetical protein
MIESRTNGVFAARFVRDIPAGSIEAPLPDARVALWPRPDESLAALPTAVAVSRTADGIPIGTVTGAITGGATVTGGAVTARSSVA